jgi:light-regulated signal transduction histidine kinase (bacteriophytochrome)
MRFAIDGASRMQTLVNDVLLYSRAGTQSLDTKPVPAERVVNTALRSLDASIAETGAVIHRSNLPHIVADEMKLSQVFQNLIANALKFRKPDLAPEVTIGAKRESHEWIFSISDNGIGFEEKYTDRIFQVFQRLHGVGRYPGNGIGLAVCKRIIEHHGGRLWAESRLGEGSCFSFSLPASSDTSPSAGKPTPKKETRTKKTNV